LSGRSRRRDVTMLFVGALIGVLVLGTMLIVVVPLLRFPAQATGVPSSMSFSLVAIQQQIQIAPNVAFDAWTFNGSVPAPTIRVTQGENVTFTLINADTMGHSIDFHAAQVAWSVDYKTIGPGQNFTFSFVPKYPGVFMYHCGTPPVLEHLGEGMYGIIIVDPVTPRAPAQEFAIAVSEFYLNSQPNSDGSYSGNYTEMLAATPNYVVFNGYANKYVANPLQVVAGQPVRLYVLNEGPTLFTAFHVIGNLFDKVYVDGNPANQLVGVQTYTIPPGGGAVFELTFPAPGQYLFVTHSFAYTGLGAEGIFNVSAAGTTLPSSQTTTTGSTSTTASATQVSILLNGAYQNHTKYYSPDPVTVVVGVNNTITWTNDDTMTHTVTSRTGIFDSGQIMAGMTWTYTFNTPGTYNYYCTLHPWMNGTVTVLAP
jgi:copper-containing nitrite reductase